ncbi:MAG: transketolase family protein [Lachnospiraceae bacterium]|nr:transketolase family protein [Lachnospiraceae bacterium]
MTNVVLAPHVGEKDEREMRKAFAATLIDLAKDNKDIVVLDADLAGAMGTKAFGKEFPDRFLDVGIQEQNMIGVACGMSVAGKIPFTHTFGPFASRRVADQVFMSGVYNKANVKIVGSDPGITAAMNGGTHMPFEDMGIMLLMPEMTIIEPSDIVMLKSLIPQMVDTWGMMYMRLVRKEVARIYDEGSSFEIGKAAQLKDGSDVTLVASGYLVAEAYKAAEQLEKENISARVLDCFTWKPIDEEALIRAAKETGAIVTCENHNVINGLGASVASVLAKNAPVPMEMIGVQDEFGEVGPVSYLRERFHMTAEDVAAAARKVVARK